MEQETHMTPQQKLQQQLDENLEAFVPKDTKYKRSTAVAELRQRQH